jgi:hypothetical protein
MQDKIARWLGLEYSDGIERGGIWARQQVLRLQLRERFGKLPPATAKTINATYNVRRLNAWLKRVLTAETLAEMGIGPARK